MGVTLKSRHVVVPGEPTWQGVLPLSELDQVGLVSHTSVLYFYDRPIKEWVDPSKNKIIDTLRNSLSDALVHFHPLAGRLRWIEGSRLELDCNAMGAELVEADSTDKITDFGDFVDSSKLMFRDLLAELDYENRPIEEIPLLSVQVTRFACGGICLGMQTSHVITDGRCAFHFFKEWARLARGEPLEIAPFLDRLALKHTVAPHGDDEFEVDPSHPFAQLADANNNSIDELEGGPLVPTSVAVVTAEQVERLKKLANNKEHVLETQCRPYSRFEVVTAQVWRCMTMASEPEPGHVTTVYIIADGRNRLNPPLPSSYFGNAVVPVSASSSAGELISRPLSYACSKVREAAQQLTDKYIRDTIEYFATEKSMRNHQFMEDRGDMVGSSKRSLEMWVISWLNLLPDGLDFGWGNEIYAGAPTGLGDGTNLWISPHYPVDDGSLKLAIGSLYEDKFFNIFNSFMFE